MEYLKTFLKVNVCAFTFVLIYETIDNFLISRKVSKKELDNLVDIYVSDGLLNKYSKLFNNHFYRTILNSCFYPFWYINMIVNYKTELFLSLKSKEKILDGFKKGYIIEDNIFNKNKYLMKPDDFPECFSKLFEDSNYTDEEKRDSALDKINKLIEGESMKLLYEFNIKFTKICNEVCEYDITDEEKIDKIFDYIIENF